jgi:hypothetical protein
MILKDASFFFVRMLLMLVVCCPASWMEDVVARGIGTFVVCVGEGCLENRGHDESYMAMCNM